MNNKKIWILLSRLHMPERMRRSRLRRSDRHPDEYADVAMVNYSDSSGLWRIYDRPDENRMKIGPSLARSLGGAFGPEVTFVPPTMGETQRTAQSWLASRGRPARSPTAACSSARSGNSNTPADEVRVMRHGHGIVLGALCAAAFALAPERAQATNRPVLRRICGQLRRLHARRTIPITIRITTRITIPIATTTRRLGAIRRTIADTPSGTTRSMSAAPGIGGPPTTASSLAPVVLGERPLVARRVAGREADPPRLESRRSQALGRSQTQLAR